MRDVMQGPGAPAARSAEEVQVDRQLELEAKKAALRSLEAQNTAPGVAEAPAAPAPPASGERTVTVTITENGRTLVLTNPSPRQLQRAGISTGTGSPPIDKEAVITLTMASLGAVVAVTWIVMHYLRRGRAAVNPKADAESAARMARIENAIESVAVEVERISEGQRFTSRLLSEGAAMPVAGAAHGERVLQHNEER